MLDDAQAHRLPKDEATRARIAAAMGAADWPAMLAQLNAHRAAVSRHFKAVVLSGGEDSDGAAVKVDLGRFWDSQAEEAALAESLARAGFAESAAAARMLLELRGSAFVRKLDEPGRKRLQALVPALVADVAAGKAPLDALRRILKVVEAIGQRSVYFALLQESGGARRRLVELCARGDFLADQIATHPLLLDELLDEQLFSQLPTRESLARDLDVNMQQVG